MNSPGGGSGDLLVSARSALLDAAEALSEQAAVDGLIARPAWRAARHDLDTLWGCQVA
jgi:hypothetical protein